MKSVFLGSPPFATPVLAALLASEHRPSLVVTPPPRPRGRGQRTEPNPVAEIARASGVAVLEPTSVREPAAHARLADEAADVFLVVAYGELLRAEFLALPRLCALNVHPSLLPRWRGATPIPAAIRAGDEVTGTSLQRIVLALDAGDVLLQERLAIRPGETAGELGERLAELSGRMTLEGLRQLADGTARFTPQDPAGVSVCRKLKKEDGRVDWSRPAAELERHVRAMNPWPLAHTTLPDGRQLAVLRARAQAHAPAGAEPGVLLPAGDAFLVASGAGALVLELVQVQGKKPLAAAEFLRGARLEPGARFGAE